MAPYYTWDETQTPWHGRSVHTCSGPCQAYPPHLTLLLLLLPIYYFDLLSFPHHACYCLRSFFGCYFLFLKLFFWSFLWLVPHNSGLNSNGTSSKRSSLTTLSKISPRNSLLCEFAFISLSKLLLCDTNLLIYLFNYLFSIFLPLNIKLLEGRNLSHSRSPSQLLESAEHLAGTPYILDKWMTECMSRQNYRGK